MECNRSHVLGVAFQCLHTCFVLVVPNLYQPVYHDDIIQNKNDIIDRAQYMRSKSLKIKKFIVIRRTMYDVIRMCNEGKYLSSAPEIR